MSRTGTSVIIAAVVVAIAGGVFYALRGGTAKSPAGVPAGAPAAGVPGGAPMGGAPGGPPGGAGMGKDFQRQHQYTLQLVRLVNNIGRMESSGKAPLTQAQAKSILAVLQPLRQHSSLDETAAKDGLKALQAVLTDKQRSAIAVLPAEHPFRQGPSGGPGAQPPAGGPGGQPGPQPAGPPPGSGPQEMKEFNPLNPPAGGPEGPQGAEGPASVFQQLQKKAGAAAQAAKQPAPAKP